MDFSRRLSPAYSRDGVSHHANAPGNAAVSHAVRPSLTESTSDSLLQSRMSLSHPRAEEKISAISYIANRLLFADGFQAEILRAVRIVHVDLRVTLAQGVTSDAVTSVENYTTTLSSIFSRWTRRHQAFSTELESIDFKNPSRTNQESISFKDQILRLPEINGCELNCATAQRLHKFFGDFVSPFSAARASTHALPHVSAAAQAIELHLAMIQDRLEDAAFSSEQLSRDTVKAWQKVAKMKAEIEERAPQREDDKPSNPKSPFQTLFGKIKGHKKKESKENSKRDEKDLPPLDLGLSEAGKRPRLAVLPPAPLPVLERQQEDIQRHHEISRRHSQFSCPGTIRVVSNSSQNGICTLYEHRHDSLPVLESHRRIQGQQSEFERKDTLSSISEEDRSLYPAHNNNHHEGVPRREQVIDERYQSFVPDLPELSQLEQEIIEAVTPGHNSKPDSTGDPEAAKSWWRQRALRDLEAGMTGGGDEQSGDQAHAEQEKDLNTEGQARWKKKATATALAMLEGGGGDEGTQSRDDVRYDFSKLSFGPDESEHIGRQL